MQSKEQYKLFNQFKVVKKIGRGSISWIYLVQNTQKQLYALKIVDKSYLKNSEQYQIYVNAEIQHLNKIKNKKIKFNKLVKYYGMVEDEQKIGLLFQYCDGGDLLNVQAKLQGKVFALQQAAKVLSQVLMALQELQQVGYTHGNLKNQKVYVFNKENQFVIKLKGFGYPNYELLPLDFWTEGITNYNYLSPQTLTRYQKVDIYDEQKSYQQFFNIEQSRHDIWSFGILFYFMLNCEFPFKFNPHSSNQKKIKQLKQLVLNFSYKTCVSKSKKQILNNCNDQTQDFFRRVFQFDKQKRITLKQIKLHPLFVKYFQKAQKININYQVQFNYENFIKLQKKLQMTQLQIQKLKKQNQELKIKGEQTKKLSKQIKELINQHN